MYDFSIIFEKFHLFLPAAVETLKITAAAIIVGMVIGLLTAFARISAFKVLRYPASAYVTIIRGTPILLQLFIVYYGLSGIIKLDPYPSAIIAFGVHNGAYIAEIFRGAIKSIDKGQMEAARSIGMSKFKAMYRIILPQAFKRAIPPLGNQLIIATKDSSLASAVTVRELLLKSQQLGSSTYRFMEYFLIAGIYYFIITSVLGLIIHKVEKRLDISSR
ncbi:amino acid ABC transporter membrane protein (PAAT family) [Anaerobacterium chartisolvens]|uniref:Amino acid ABC transporter membrane protein (PAAT family) n=1 Tax=Anaerobacterium chartisolvens TaxID=1297424 RepID=A0A369B8K3_9FIRM|nr:amino acid ABC transporter permease [Anaerobacterium chartisolvens]RCX17859.1 amino acid ABC transporter membrane protein (PAAT family) [Anaerobacterium chartisolvens]